MVLAPPAQSLARCSLHLLLLALWALAVAAWGLFDDREDVRRASREEVATAMLAGGE